MISRLWLKLDDVCYEAVLHDDGGNAPADWNSDNHPITIFKKVTHDGNATANQDGNATANQDDNATCIPAGYSTLSRLTIDPVSGPIAGFNASFFHFGTLGIDPSEFVFGVTISKVWRVFHPDNYLVANLTAGATFAPGVTPVFRWHDAVDGNCYEGTPVWDASSNSFMIHLTEVDLGNSPPVTHDGNATANQDDNATANQDDNATANQDGNATANQDGNATANQDDNATCIPAGYSTLSRLTIDPVSGPIAGFNASFSHFGTLGIDPSEFVFGVTISKVWRVFHPDNYLVANLTAGATFAPGVTPVFRWHDAVDGNCYEGTPVWDASSNSFMIHLTEVDLGNSPPVTHDGNATANQDGNATANQDGNATANQDDNATCIPAGYSTLSRLTIDPVSGPIAGFNASFSHFGTLGIDPSEFVFGVTISKVWRVFHPDNYLVANLTAGATFAPGVTPVFRWHDAVDGNCHEGTPVWDASSNSFMIHLTEVDLGNSPPVTHDGNAKDSDSDGLYDAYETYLGTNPNVADTDGDGLNDGQEVTAGTDPKISDKTVIDAVKANSANFGLVPLTSLTATGATPHTNGWYYQPEWGWIWTNANTFPYVYRSSSGGKQAGWLYFREGSVPPYFHDYATGTWTKLGE